MAARSITTDAVRTRPSPNARRRFACVCVPAVVLAEVVAIIAGGNGAAASTPVTTMFNGATQLVGTAGAVPTAAVANSSGGMLVIGSTATGEGCTLSTLGRDGASTTYLGRTPGGVNCTVTSLARPSATDGIAVVSQTATGLVGGSSSNGGESFGWSVIASVGIPKALAADPAPTPGSIADLFLIVENARTGVPYVAVSTNAGMTFSLGSSLINPADIPTTAGGGQALVVGNLVARRGPTGLSLYSTLEIGNSTATQPGQSTSPPVLSQVYEAVGTVSAGTPANPAPSAAAVTPTKPAPSVTWRDAEAYSAPAGTSLDAHGAVTTVDGAGRVYTAFSAGGHVYLKSEQMGLAWNLFTPPTSIDTTSAGAPAGADTAVAPSIAAGGGGMVDVAWLESPRGLHSASGTWAVFMAQTVNGGSSWHAYRVTRSAVHDGAPAGSVQVVVDPASGAASLAYSDDLAAPGTPSLFATRQCGGLSATTGGTLAGGCAAPRPTQTVLPGSICSGPQVRNRAFDAVHNGANIPALDVYTARFATVNASSEAVTLTVGRVSSVVPSGVLEALWRVTWSQGGVHFYAQAAMLAGDAATFSVGIMNTNGSPGPSVPVPGHMATLSDGSNTGAITIEIPFTAIGRPVPGTLMTNIAADSLAVFKGALSTPQLVDHAPDSSRSAAFTVLQACAPEAVVPEAPSAALLPLVGGFAGLAIAWTRRRRRQVTTDE